MDHLRHHTVLARRPLKIVRSRRPRRTHLRPLPLLRQVTRSSFHHLAIQIILKRDPSTPIAQPSLRRCARVYSCLTLVPRSPPLHRWARCTVASPCTLHLCLIRWVRHPGLHPTSSEWRSPRAERAGLRLRRSTDASNTTFRSPWAPSPSPSVPNRRTTSPRTERSGRRCRGARHRVGRPRRRRRSARTLRAGGAWTLRAGGVRRLRRSVDRRLRKDSRSTKCLLVRDHCGA